MVRARHAGPSHESWVSMVTAVMPMIPGVHANCHDSLTANFGQTWVFVIARACVCVRVRVCVLSQGRGEQAVKKIGKDNVQLVVVDVSSDESVSVRLGAKTMQVAALHKP